VRDRPVEADHGRSVTQPIRPRSSDHQLLPMFGGEDPDQIVVAIAVEVEGSATLYLLG
jgi:hypothetical protein